MLGYSKTEEYEAGQYKLTLDGKIIGDEYSYASVYGERRNAYVRDSDLYEQISVLTLNEILGDFTEVHFWYPNLLNDEVISFLLSDIIINRTNDNAITVKFEFNFNDSEWKQPWRM